MLTCQRVGLVVIDLITSPVVSWRGCETPPQYRGSAVILCSTTVVERTSLFVVACYCRLLGLVYVGGWTWTFFLDISVEYFLSFLLVYIKNYTDYAKGCGDRKHGFFLSVVDQDFPPRLA